MPLERHSAGPPSGGSSTYCRDVATIRAVEASVTSAYAQAITLRLESHSGVARKLLRGLADSGRWLTPRIFRNRERFLTLMVAGSLIHVS